MARAMERGMAMMPTVIPARRSLKNLARVYFSAIMESLTALPKWNREFLKVTMRLLVLMVLI